MRRLSIGDAAPQIPLPNQKGKTVSLADYVDKKTVVLFFYPKDETPICTREACAFRDAYDDFLDAGAAVVGVSSDSADSHTAFAKNHDLRFTLLADEKGELREAFGVPKSLGFLPGRVTYVIDKRGTIRHIFSSQLSVNRHVAEALQTVNQLSVED